MFDGASPPIHDTATPSFLLVGQDRSMLACLGTWVSGVGYRCIEADGAPSAMDWLQQNEIHVVLLEIPSRDCPGMQFLAEIKRRWPDIEVIVVAVETSLTATEATDRGAYGYLATPVRHADVIFLVQKALDRRKLVLEKRHYARSLEEKIREQRTAVRRAHEETILRLVSASRYRDEETGAHVKRVGLYCEAFAETLGWPEDEVDNLRMAAPMHDLGKIGIPDAILKKPGRLAPEEFAVMKTHTMIGAKMLEGSESAVLQMAMEIALCHHEWWDGSGYPRGLKQLEIPEPARIVSIVDVYDALTHRRIYHAAMPEDQALDVMNQGCGTHFDPFLFSVFLALMPEVRRIARENPDEGIDEYVGLAFPGSEETAEKAPITAGI